MKAFEDVEADDYHIANGFITFTTAKGRVNMATYKEALVVKIERRPSAGEPNDG